MMTGPGSLARLSDVDVELVDESADIRGRKVVDAAGEEFGKVDDLLVDQEQSRVRFMEVSTGGFLGIGKDKFTIPVDAVTNITDDEVMISRLKADVEGGPSFEEYAASEDGREYWTRVYGHYGANPYWTPGYTEPSYPRYQRPM